MKKHENMFNNILEILLCSHSIKDAFEVVLVWSLKFFHWWGLMGLVMLVT